MGYSGETRRVAEANNIGGQKRAKTLKLAGERIKGYPLNWEEIKAGEVDK